MTDRSGRTCPEPGGCESCPDPDYCRTLRCDSGVTTPGQERIIGGIVRSETVCNACVQEGEALLTWARFYLSTDDHAGQFKCDRCHKTLAESHAA